MQPVDIKRIRKKLNFSQKEFADKLGTSVRSVINWEKGDTEPQAKFLTQLYEISNSNTQEVAFSNLEEAVHLKKDGVRITSKEIEEFILKNESHFFNRPNLKSAIELRVAKKVILLMNNPEEIKRWLKD